MPFSRIAFLLFAIAVSGTSCAPKELDDASSAQVCWASGDMIISNSGSDAVMVLKPDGTFRSIAYNVVNTSETVAGLTFNRAGELLVVVDGTDRVMAISQADCSSRILIADPNLTGTLKGIAVLADDDILVAETSNVERFRPSGVRVTTGGWPRALQIGATGLSATASGGFVHCSTTSDVLRTYDDAGTQLATRSSGIAGTTDASDCLVLRDGSIAVTWSGTTDTVSVVTSDLSTQTSSFSDTNILAVPGGVAEAFSGNLLVLDRFNHYIVEITRAGAFVQILGDGFLNIPEFITVAP